MSRGPGRPKGSLNKITADLRAAIIGAFKDAGGRKYLARLAETHPQVFSMLLGKILPTEVVGEGGGPLTIKIIRYSEDVRA